MRLFGGSALERRLEELYTGMFQSLRGMSASEAKRMARDQLKLAKEQSRKDGTDKLPDNFGDVLLQRERTDAHTTKMLRRKRAEGVRDEDIRWWWNMHDLERQMMIGVDNTSRMALFIETIQNTGSPEKAAERVRKSFPMFGDPDETTNVSGEDRLLPTELKDRVNVHAEKHMMPDAEAARAKLERFSSYNAFLRAELKEGRL